MGWQFHPGLFLACPDVYFRLYLAGVFECACLQFCQLGRVVANTIDNVAAGGAAVAGVACAFIRDARPGCQFTRYRQCSGGYNQPQTESAAGAFLAAVAVAGRGE